MSVLCVASLQRQFSQQTNSNNSLTLCSVLLGALLSIFTVFLLIITLYNMGGFLVFVFLYDAEMYSNLAEGCGDK